MLREILPKVVQLVNCRARQWDLGSKKSDLCVCSLFFPATQTSR